ncbi:hypothetical protein UFOVP1623_5 [uncultured Caudovirales phage]|uniref:Uncharacterized protein n=1 Tax=uncultured Caudovirales phage TaxID=2100421 RepID=A0A6J5RUU2_9CAUD|nr:hypothetical protein UFOVP1376_4 [uncultured Caudovirales phage]CAB4220613.1 hypothetical protein UFOVP1623_5 [uncultured Caudovirales phage]
MARHGYVDDDGDGEQWDLIRWRGAVKSALRGARGQSFLREMLIALDAMPEKRLVREELLNAEGEMCTLGVIGTQRGLDMTTIDPEDRDAVSAAFGIPLSMACEIMYENDDGRGHNETPERRWTRMRGWVAINILEEQP